MQKFIISLLIPMLFFTQVHAATASLESSVDVKSKVQELYEIPEATCYADYMKRRKRIIIGVFATPFAGVAAAYGLGAIGASGGNGWDALGYAILGVLGGLAIASGFEIYYLGSWLRINSVIRTIKQAYGMDGDRMAKFRNKLLRKRPDLSDSVTSEWVSLEIQKLNENGSLCNGSLKRKKNAKVLKKRLAYNRDIIKFLKREMINQFGR